MCICIYILCVCVRGAYDHGRAGVRAVVPTKGQVGELIYVYKCVWMRGQPMYVITYACMHVCIYCLCVCMWVHLYLCISCIPSRSRGRASRRAHERAGEIIYVCIRMCMDACVYLILYVSPPMCVHHAE